VVLLGSVERIRALRDTGEFNAAQQGIADLRRQLAGEAATDFGRKLVVALLECSVEQARVAGMSRPNAALADAAIQPLVRLAKEKPAYRDEVYAVLYGMLTNEPRPDQLHPFQQCALVAGQIAEATRLRMAAEQASTEMDREQRDQQAVDLLNSAVQIATSLVASRGRIAPDLHCESLYNLAVGQFHLGRRLDAATHFRAVAEECPRFHRALPAATYAVEIAAQLAQDASLAGRQEVQRLYVDALQTLIDRFADSAAASYWRFFYAQALADFGQLDRAADVYGEVDDAHPNAILARFRAVRCQVLSFKQALNDGDLEGPAIQIRVSAIRRAAEFLKALVAKADSARPAAAMDLQRLLAESDVVIAELDVLPEVGQPDRALARLEGFERRYATYPDLLGRVLRVRIVAQEATGQLDAARQTVPAYIASAPEEAGRTLQALFDATWAGFNDAKLQEPTPESRRKARAALLFAEQLEQWAAARTNDVTAYDRYVLRVQRAEAALAAGDVAEALTLFEDCLAREPGLDEIAGPNPRTIMGMARALDALQRYEEALAWYNKAYRGAAPAAPLRFQALLGDLRCRYALGTPAATLRDIIAQHRVLQPAMGGPELKAAFQTLERSWPE
jgi:tetratricopeptide (TPR) repeat protein